MSNAVVTTSHAGQGAIVESASSAASLRAQIQLVQQAMREVMIEGVHYGRIPGTPKPSLWKPGAEILCTMFHIAPSYRIDDLSDERRVRYRVTCTGTHQGTGTVLGEGLGSANSDEEKYQWRDAICDDEFAEALADQKRAKWQRGREGSRPFKRLQIRVDPANAENTVLQMACKRAHIAMTKAVLAASDIFSQDLEDLPEEMLPDEHATPRQRNNRRTGAQPRPRSNAVPEFATESQVRLMRARLNDAGMSAEDVCKRFNVDSITRLPFDRVNDALAYIADPERDAIRQEAESTGG